MTETKLQSTYLPQLDSLRFFAVAAVMIAHTWHPPKLPGIIGDLDWAGLGVRLFFVLSGFLITGILLRCRELAEKSIQPASFYLRQFYIRRFLRIFPIYYLTIFIALLFDIPGARDAWGWLLTYTANIHIAFDDTWIGSMGHFWTLAVEEHYYLVWPWIVLFTPKKWLLPILLVIIPVGPIFRVYGYLSFPFDIGAMDFKASTLTPAVLDVLGIGSLLSLVWNSSVPKETIQKYLTRVVLPTGVIIYLICLVLYHYRVKPSVFFVVGDLAAAMIFAWLISSAASGFKGMIGEFLQLRIFKYLGKISYGIYVYHNLTPLLVVPLFKYLGIRIQVPGLENFIFSSFLTLALASLSWKFIELPINNLKEHFDYTPKSTSPKLDIAAAGK